MSAAVRRNCPIVLAALLILDVTAAIAQVPFAIPASTRPDFNRDGKDDLAIGVPGENGAAGAVHIIYGSTTGLSEVGDQFISQNSAGIPGGEEGYDQCGAALATGDFNGDGYADLAFGCPGEDTPASEPSAGAVIVVYGSSAGLTGAGSQFWSQNSTGINGGSEANDTCGSSVASGDINRDGFADLVWGCPGEDVGAIENAGAVNVLFGSATGLAASGNRFLSQDTTGIPDAAEAQDRCGHTVAAGDFNGDGFADVAWGCPTEDIGIFLNAGGVSVAFGISSGISEATGLFVDQNTARSSSDEGVEANDECGRGLAVGDFNNDGRADLVFGCPGEDIFLVANDVGSIYVLFGVRTSVLSFGSVILNSGTSRCGAAITTGRFSNDSFADIAYGCAGNNSGAGQVRIIGGTSTAGVLAAQAQLTQNTFGVPDSSEPGDNFGHAVSAGDFDGDGFSDLAVGVPNEDRSTFDDNGGAVNVIYFPLPSLDPVRSQLFTQESTGIVDATEINDYFGFSLPGSGAPVVPGLTGRWGQDLAVWCRGAACTLTGTFTAINPSLAPTPRVALRVYLSDDQVLDGGDVLLDEMPVKPLDKDESQARRVNIVLPQGMVTTGRYVIAFVDADNIVEEANEANNIVVSEAIR
jgi:hypothetical protein